MTILTGRNLAILAKWLVITNFLVRLTFFSNFSRDASLPLLLQAGKKKRAVIDPEDASNVLTRTLAHDQLDILKVISIQRSTSFYIK